MALEAAKKAYQLRQAAHGATNSQAREDALATAVNKEIEAESFGKAAKYTRSGAFQGLAAGAGLGIQPGVTIGKLTGALVGGVVSSVGAVLAGGVGSVYGAINGPMWDLGQMAGKGVNSIVGEWLPDWEVTSSQKKALEKMVVGTQQTQAPSQDELQQMADDNGGMDEMEQGDRDQWVSDLRGYIPNMPKMPNVSKNMPSMPGMPSMPSWGGWGGGGQKQQQQPQQQAPRPPQQQQQQQQANTSAKRSMPSVDPAKAQQQAQQQPRQAPAPAQPQQQPQQTQPQQKPQQPAKQAAQPDKKKPRKLEPRSTNSSPKPAAAGKKAPPKLQSRAKAA